MAGNRASSIVLANPIEGMVSCTELKRGAALLPGGLLGSLTMGRQMMAATLPPTTGARRKARFPLELPLTANWSWSREGEGVHEQGTVRDISANGVYFVLSRDLKPEVRPKGKLEFSVRLNVKGAPKGGVLLQCVGSVVRVESKEAGRIGVAARIQRYRFVRLGDPA